MYIYIYVYIYIYKYNICNDIYNKYNIYIYIYIYKYKYDIYEYLYMNMYIHVYIYTINLQSKGSSCSLFESSSVQLRSNEDLERPEWHRETEREKV